jgi:hypothetical protein
MWFQSFPPLDEPVLLALARRDVGPVDIALLRLSQNRHAGLFGAVIADDHVGPYHPLEDRCIEFTPDPCAGD